MVCMIFLLSLECLNKCRDVESCLCINRHSIWLNGKLLPQFPGHSPHENTHLSFAWCVLCASIALQKSNIKKYIFLLTTSVAYLKVLMVSVSTTDF